MTWSDQPEPPAIAIVRQNSLSSASSRASVADTPVSRQICRRHVSTPAKAAHHPSSWHRFGGSSLPEHHFEVWRHNQRGPVFVYGRCMRRRTSRYVAKLRRWTWSRASWCAGCVVDNVDGRNPVFSNRLVWGSRLGKVPIGLKHWQERKQ